MTDLYSLGSGSICSTAKESRLFSRLSLYLLYLPVISTQLYGRQCLIFFGVSPLIQLGTNTKTRAKKNKTFLTPPLSGTSFFFPFPPTPWIRGYSFTCIRHCLTTWKESLHWWLLFFIKPPPSLFFLLFLFSLLFLRCTGSDARQVWTVNKIRTGNKTKQIT